MRLPLNSGFVTPTRPVSRRQIAFPRRMKRGRGPARESLGMRPVLNGVEPKLRPKSQCSTVLDSSKEKQKHGKDERMENPLIFP